MSAFLLEILTPDKPFFKGEVESLVVKGQQGFLGILARHAPLLARLASGPLRFKTAEGEQVIAAGAGLLEVTSAGVTILTDSAEPAH
jgi:F-type H+-transporting ATPase subunit epsilon